MKVLIFTFLLVSSISFAGVQVGDVIRYEHTLDMLQNGKHNVSKSSVEEMEVKAINGSVITVASTSEDSKGKKTTEVMDLTPESGVCAYNFDVPGVIQNCVAQGYVETKVVYKNQQIKGCKLQIRNSIIIVAPIPFYLVSCMIPSLQGRNGDQLEFITKNLDTK